jgi:hypothetical protein
MTDYRQAAVEEAVAQGVDPHLVLRMMNKESGGRPDARSPKGASGLMQLMPGTAAELGVDPRDPKQNLRGGVTYLKQQLDTFGGDPRLAAAAYNAGPGAVRRHGGVPPYAETQDYVQTVARPAAGGEDPGYDQDVFGGLGGSPATPASAPSANGPLATRGADGSIEMDIDRSTNPDFLAGRQQDPGYDQDVFPAAPPVPVNVQPLEPIKAQKTFMGDFGEVVGGSIDKLKTDFRAAYDQSSRPKPFGESLKDFATDPLGVRDGLKTAGLAGDVAGVALSPIGGVMHGLLRPPSEAIADRVPVYDSGLLSLLRNPLEAPRRLSKDDAAKKLEGDLGMALSSGLPGKGLAGGGLAAGAAQPGLNLTGKSARVPAIVAKTISRDRLHVDSLLAALQGRSPHTMPFETAGENMVGLAEHLGQIPGAGRDFGIERLTQRSATAPDRIKKVVDDVLGGSGDYFKTKNDLVIRRAEESKPHFELAFPQAVDADHFETVFRPIVARLPKGALDHAYDLARREGRVPEELGLQKGSGPEGRATRAAPPEEVSAEDLAALRSGKKAPGPGPGLLEFISKNGGLKDFGGELRAKDLDIWHQKRPFVAKLLRPDGLSDEAMGQKLFEAGYFPEKVAGRMDSADNMTRVTAKDLHDAVDQELAGKVRFARASEDPGRAARLEELERRLQEAGVDPRTATAKQASQALGQLRDDIARNEAFARDSAPGPAHDELVQVVNPTLETLHYVKMGLDEALEVHRNPVTGKLELDRTAAGRADAKTRHDLGEALRETNPDYAAAMGAWGARSSDIKALNLGRDVFSPKFEMQSEQLSNVFGDMTRTERAHYRKGVGEALVAKVRSSGGGVKTMRDLLRSEEYRARVRLAFKGQKAYDAFVANAMKEVKMQDRFNQVNSGSQTFRRQAQADVTAHDGLDGGDLVDAGISTVTGNPGGAVTGVARKFFKSEAMKNQEVLRDPAANKLLGEALFDDGDTLMRLLHSLKNKSKPKGAGRYGRLNLARPLIPQGDGSASRSRNAER